MSPRPIMVALTALLLPACQAEGPPPAQVGGDPVRGGMEITRSGCGACHHIPGLQQADGMVGPPLDHFARRTMIAGLLPNTPRNLVTWVRQSQTVLPGNAMPDTPLTDGEARDVAAYLYTLR